MAYTAITFIDGDPVPASVLTDLSAAVAALSTGPQLLPVAFKTADQTVNNSTTLVDDVALFVPLEASSMYTFEMYVPYNTGATPDLKVGWTVPALATSIASVDYWDTAAVIQRGQITTTPTTGFAIGGFGADLYARFSGSVVTAASAGNFQTKWAQNTANASNSIVRSGAYLAFTKVA